MQVAKHGLAAAVHRQPDRRVFWAAGGTRAEDFLDEAEVGSPAESQEVPPPREQPGAGYYLGAFQQAGQRLSQPAGAN